MVHGPRSDLPRGTCQLDRLTVEAARSERLNHGFETEVLGGLTHILLVKKWDFRKIPTWLRVVVR